jgi:hypothetical protein
MKRIIKSRKTRKSRVRKTKKWGGANKEFEKNKKIDEDDKYFADFKFKPTRILIRAINQYINYIYKNHSGTNMKISNNTDSMIELLQKLIDEHAEVSHILAKKKEEIIKSFEDLVYMHRDSFPQRKTIQSSKQRVDEWLSTQSAKVEATKAEEVEAEREFNPRYLGQFVTEFVTERKALNAITRNAKNSRNRKTAKNAENAKTAGRSVVEQRRINEAKIKATASELRP